MIKKVKIEQLKPGVFIHDLNSSWLDHPFLRNQITIKNEREIEKLIKYGTREVYIDTTNGIDIDDAPTKQEVEREIEAAGRRRFGLYRRLRIRGEVQCRFSGSFILSGSKRTGARKESGATRTLTP